MELAADGPGCMELAADGPGCMELAVERPGCMELAVERGLYLLMFDRPSLRFSIMN